MNLSKIKSDLRKDPYVKDIVVFLDKENGIQLASIRIVPNVVITIKSFNESAQPTGYMDLWFHPNNRIFLDVIYCYDQFRGKGIAGNLSQIADFVLKDYSGYIIRGVYQPSQLSTDREKKIERSQEELNERADNFYSSACYTKIYYDDYITDPSKYPDIDVDNDFQLGEEIAKCIITKKVVSNGKYPFKRIKDVLVSENILTHLKNRKTEFLDNEGR